MKATWFVSLVAAAILVAGAPAHAQVFTPTFQSPRLINDIGIYLSDGPGDLSLEGIWRGGPLGLRVGYVDAQGGVLSVGGELRSPLATVGMPVGLAFTAAAQGLIGDASAIGLQGGLSAGYTFMPDGIALTPYIHPRLAAVNNFGPDDFEFEVLADVGVDAELFNNLVVRLGINLADLGAGWGLGLSIRQ